MAPTHHHLRRSFSSCNQTATSMIEKYITDQEDAFNEKRSYLLKHVTKSCMIIPCLEMLDNNGRREALCSIVDTEALVKCEKSNIINWWKFSRLTMPLFVEENSISSLYDSVSLFIWGICHGSKTLLKFVQHFVIGKEEDLCKQYFIHYAKDLANGNASTESFQSIDWKDIIVYLSKRSTSTCEDDELLDGCSSHTELSPITISFVIFLLSNVIGRPIIVSHGPSPNERNVKSISGIYIPLIRKQDECERSPVILLYYAGRFMPLFSCEDKLNPLSSKTITDDAAHCFPLCYSSLKHFKVHFIESNLNQTDSCINLACLPVISRYMDISMMPTNQTTSSTEMPVVFLTFNAPPSYSLQLQWSWLRSIHGRLLNNTKSGVLVNPKLCSRSTFGCENEGIVSLKGLCLGCYTAFVTVSSNVPKRKISLIKTIQQDERKQNSGSKAIPMCITSGCNKPQVEHLLDRCRNCYLDHFIAIKEQTVKPLFKECCFTDCKSASIDNMDLCNRHLNQLQNQEHVESKTFSNQQSYLLEPSYYNDFADGPKPGPKHGNAFLQLPPNFYSLPTQGRGAIDSSLQTSHSIQPINYSRSSPNLRTSKHHDLSSMQQPRSLPIDNEERKRKNTFTVGRSEGFPTSTENHLEDFEVVDSFGNLLGTTGLQKCLLPECEQIVDDENDVVCKDCSRVQQDTLHKIENGKQERKFQPIPPTICKIPQCPMPVSSMSNEFCSRCEEDQCSSSPSSDPRCTTDTDYSLSRYNPQSTRTNLPPEFESILKDALSSSNPDVNLNGTTGPCRTQFCDLFGTKKFNGYCSKCFHVKNYPGRN